MALQNKILPNYLNFLPGFFDLICGTKADNKAFNQFCLPNCFRSWNSIK